MKHCVIRHPHFKAVLGKILALSQAGFNSRWCCKKVDNEWTATSIKPIAYSVKQLEKAVA